MSVRPNTRQNREFSFNIGIKVRRIVRDDMIEPSIGEVLGEDTLSGFLKTSKKEKVEMDKAIVAVYENTKDAALVEEHFGEALIEAFDDEFTRRIWLQTHKAAYLTEATERQAEVDVRRRSR